MIPTLLLVGLAVGVPVHDRVSLRRSLVIGVGVSLLWGIIIGVGEQGSCCVLRGRAPRFGECRGRRNPRSGRSQHHSVEQSQVAPFHRAVTSESGHPGVRAINRKAPQTAPEGDGGS